MRVHQVAQLAALAPHQSQQHLSHLITELLEYRTT
jgi:hypothetical protein